MSRKDKTNVLVLGGEPRVSLLPPEVNAQKRSRLLRRRLIFAVFMVLILVAAGSMGAAFYAFQAQLALAGANQETSAILAEKTKYRNVGLIADQVVLAKAARAVGSSTEIDLANYLTQMQEVLPSGASLTSVALDSGTPMSPYAQSTVPLQDSRIATITFVVSTSGLPDIEDLLNSLVTLPGYTDASPTSVGITKGHYETSIVMHINSKALAYRFVDENGVIK